MLENKSNQNIIIFLLVFFSLIFFFFKIDIKLIMIPIELKYDTILGILGNLMIAVYIASVISKKQKNDELKIDNCFKELNHLLCLLNELRTHIMDEQEENKLDDIKIRYMSLISLQIELVKKYKFIPKHFNDKLAEHYRNLDKSLTSENTICHEDYKHSSLQLERVILNIKSNIL